MSTKILAHQKISPAQNLNTNTCNKVFDASIGPSISIIQPFVLNIGLKFADKIYDNNNDYVEKVAFRKSIAAFLASRPNILDVKWRETLGVLELGPGINLCVPIDTGFGLGVSLDVGFEARGLLAYRYSQPKPVYKIAPNKADVKAAKILFPNSVEKAIKMAIGSEAELRGSGKLFGSIGTTISAGAGVMGVARTGVAVSLATCKSTLGEYCLSVTALGEKKVRVKITKINEEEAKIGCNLRAGIINLLTPDSLACDSGFKNFCVNASKCQIENLILNYVSLLASFGKNIKEKDTNICCYDLDLSNPVAQEAYVQLLSLSPASINDLLELDNTGIEIVRLNEKSDTNENIIDIQVFNRKLYLRELADIDSAGILVSQDEQRVYYCDKIYSQKFESMIHGTQQIRWEGIELIENNKPPENYYKFFYEQCANIPTQQEVNKFFDLAGRLGIRVCGEAKEKLIDMSSIKMLGSSEDDTRTVIEVFFRQPGILQLQNADSLCGSLAFQKANGFMAGEKHQPQANETLEAYHKIDNNWLSWLNRSLLQDMAREYEEKFERNFEQDYAGFVKAKNFGELVNNFHNAKNHTEAKDFFANLGKADFSYQEVLIALTALMGRENLLIHKLSLSGGNVNLESYDEGILEHPREKAQNLFDRVKPRVFNS